MNVFFEGTCESDYNDACSSWYISSSYGDYRLSMNFIGALNDDGFIDLDLTSFCTISLNEVQNNKPELLQAIKVRIEDELSIEMDTYNESVYNTNPELKSSIYIDDFNGFDNSIQIATALLNAHSLIKKILRTLGFISGT